MKKYIKILSVIAAASMVFGTFSGCTKKSETYVDSTYVIDGEADENSDGADNSESSGGVSGSTSSGSGGAGNNGGSSGTGSNTSGNGSTGTPVSEKKLKGKLELQIWVNGSDTSRVWERTVKAFEKVNPDLKVDLRMGINVNTQMQTRWMNDNPPDLILLDGTGIPTDTFQEEGKFYDLTSFLKTAKAYGEDKLIWDKLDHDCIEYFKNGKVYKAPLMTTPYGIWYDNEFLKKNGLTAPTDFDSLMSFGAAAKKKGISALCYPGVHAAYLGSALIMPAMAAYGKDYFYKALKLDDPSLFEGPEFKAIMQRFIDFAKAGYIMPGSVPLNHINAQMSWLNHKAALIPCGLWLETEMASDIPYGFDMKFSTVSLTAKGQPQATVLSGIGVAVAQKGKNRDNALEFLRYLYRDDVLLDFVEVNGYLSSCKIDMSKAKLSKAAKQALDTLNNPAVTKVYKNKSWGTMESELGNVINAIVLGDIKSADEACARMVKEAKKNKG